MSYGLRGQKGSHMQQAFAFGNRKIISLVTGNVCLENREKIK
jgi:hypothetical protein